MPCVDAHLTREAAAAVAVATTQEVLTTVAQTTSSVAHVKTTMMMTVALSLDAIAASGPGLQTTHFSGTLTMPSVVATPIITIQEAIMIIAPRIQISIITSGVAIALPIRMMTAARFLGAIAACGPGPLTILFSGIPTMPSVVVKPMISARLSMIGTICTSEMTARRS